MASLDPQIKSPPFFMPPGHFTLDQMYGLKINDHQLFFPQAHGTEVNYCPSLDLSAENLSDQGHMPVSQDNGGECLLKTRPRYQSTTLPSNFCLTWNAVTKRILAGNFREKL